MATRERTADGGTPGALGPGAGGRAAVVPRELLRWVWRVVGVFVAVRATVLVVALASAHVAGRRTLSILTSWDAQWYASIAAHGYGLTRVDGGRILSDYAFFPLYPVIESVGSSLSGVQPVVAGLVVSGVAGLVAAAGIGAVARQQGLSDGAAVVSVALWAAVPIGVVESMAYSESLFVALASWALWCALRERWWCAGVLACGAALTRPQGVAVVAAVVVAAGSPIIGHAVRRDSTPPVGRRGARLAAAGLALVGGVGYLGWVGLQRGSVTGYLQVTREWGNSFDGGVTFVRWLVRLLAGESRVGGLLCLGALALLAALLTALIRRRPSLPVTVYVVGLVVLALTSTAYFGSKPRYLLPAFPLLFPVASWLEKRGRGATVVGLTVLTAGSAAFAAWWLLGPGPP